MKKIDPNKEIESNCKILRSTPGRWIHHRDEGCQDPFWSDGVNMNLLRNHMICAKKEILRLCAEYQIPEPKELFIPIPPYVGSNYFAKPNSDRAQRVLSSNSCCNSEKPCTKKEMKSYSLQKYTQMQFMYKKEVIPMEAQKKTPLPVAAGQEGDTSSLAPNIVNQPSQSVKTSDPGLLAPGIPMLDVLEDQIAIITDNYCGIIDSLCADSTGLEIR